MELLTLLPLWYQYVLVGLLGLVIGSFLNVYIYRLHTGRSLAGSSHCLSCGTPLRWYELLPVLSYLSLRGRCRTCTSYIPFRYVLVETLTATLFLIEFYRHGSSYELLFSFVLMSILVMIAVYDIYHFIIPNELVAALGVVAVPMVLWSQVPGTLVEVAVALGWHAAAALAAAAFYAALWRISSGRWIGFGDVKLALPLGFIIGLPAVFSFVVLSFWVGAIMSVSYLGILQLLKRGQRHLRFQLVPLTIKSEVPFAPFLIISFLLVWWFDVSVLNIFTNLF